MPQSQTVLEECTATAVCVPHITTFPPRQFSADLWRRVETTIFRRILEHPFLVGLLDGSLPESCFRYYIMQDILYLREYSRALALVAQRAPRAEWAALFLSCANDAYHMEAAFHKEFLEHLAASSDLEEAPPAIPSPNNLLYTGHLLSTIHERPFHEGLAAVLPCFMIYSHVGQQLRAKGSPHALYQKWIDKYAGEDFESVVRTVERMVDEVAHGLSQEQCESMHHQYATGCRMEYLFWDGAFHKQGWPV